MKSLAWSLLLALISMPLPLLAEESAEGSPWLVTPLVSSDPKMGSSLGVLGGYLFTVDEASPVSTAMVFGTYSSTDSYVAGFFTKTYFDSDRQRVIAGVLDGEINNDYSDFLGTGLSVQTVDDLRLAFARYTYRMQGNWFIGGQAISTNYAIAGGDWLSGIIVDAISLTGFDSNGIGAVVEYDSRDNQNSPSRGMHSVLSNVAYRGSFGSDDSFDNYSWRHQQYFPQLGGNVLAMRAEARWTHNAPAAGYSSVDLRGYTRGQYLAPHSATLEFERRHPWVGRWGYNLFAGAACLYGDGEDCGQTDNWYPSAGAGISYMVKPKEKMVVRADFAVGKEGNRGFYLQFGNAF